MENTKKTGPMIAGGIVLAILVIGGIYMASQGATGNQANLSNSQMEDSVDQIQADYQTIGDVNIDAELTGIDQELQ